MKTLLPVTLFIFSACKQNTKPVSANQNMVVNSKPAIIKDTVSNQIFYTHKDTIVITTQNLDTLKYSKNDFNEIINTFPALSSTHPQDPDLTFHCSDQFKTITDRNGDSKTISFSAETGQDEYYVLYAYFLKKQFNLEPYNTQRRKLIKIYTDINAIYSRLNFGGTYFGHQNSRIIGYAEYGIYQYSTDQNFYDRSYDITRQKELYINSVRKFIDDELSIENRFNKYIISPENKKQLESDLYKLVNDMRALISDFFYLKNAQRFQYDHY